MYDGFEGFGMFGQPPMTPPPKKGSEGIIMGFVTHGERQLLESLQRDHPNTLSFEFEGSGQVRATMFSKSPEKIRWAEWLLARMRENQISLNKSHYMMSMPHPVDGMEHNSAPVAVVPMFSLNNFTWPLDPNGTF